MNWDKIEAKWAEMAQRVRSDLSPRQTKADLGSARIVSPPGDLPEPLHPKDRLDAAQ